MKKARTEEFILWFDEIGIKDVPLVGGKNASLGEMFRNLKKEKIPVPDGFAITANAYKMVLEKSGKLETLKKLLADVDIYDQKSLSETGKKAREIILHAKMPDELQAAIQKAYEKLSKKYKVENVDVAVRSSATAEDLPTASFAGQQETFLHIIGLEKLIEACRHCFASLFTNRAIVYRVEKGFDHFKVFLSIGVEKMVRSDLASAGVLFTLDTETGFPNVVYITGSYGLGESVVQGAVNPDEFYVFKPTLIQNFKPIIEKRLGAKETKIIYSNKKSSPLKNITTSKKERSQFCLTDNEVLLLAKWGALIEEHYSRINKKWTPMDLEWAKDGITNELFIVQARPETVQSQRKANIIEEYKLVEKGKILTTGASVGTKIANGKANVIRSAKEIGKFKEGEILVTEMTDPDWVPIMRIAKAIVTNRGGRTSHAAIVSRELGLPCIVGTHNATSVIKTGKEVTISCAEGPKGVVYEGILDFKIHKTDVSKAGKPKTKIMVNIGTPDEAFELSFLPSDGVGLARQEFIVSESIKIHPMALARFDQIKDSKARRQILKLTAGYKDKKAFFVDRLASGVAKIAAAFYPRDVILRFSDFKTNEYANLIGGKEFEPKEANPMIGWRGASRYYHPKYKEGFALECQAIKKVRDEFGLFNLKVMIPVCRTPEEGKKVIQTMKENGLTQGAHDLQIYVMCEVPSNVILADQFAKIFDGFSIGSNDLTQLALGIDRDSELISDLYDERSDAVKRMVAMVIEVARQNKIKIGICGDAPSTFPEFAKFLVDCGIDSISLSPDAVIKTRLILSEYEKKKKSGTKLAIKRVRKKG